MQYFPTALGRGIANCLFICEMSTSRVRNSAKYSRYKKRRKMKIPEYQEVLRTWLLEITVVDIIDRGESLLTYQTGRKYPSSCYL